MSAAKQVWALILAGGDGSRLRALTTKPCGTAVPKQFCSLHGGRSLLEDAILRATNLVAPERICTIVAQQHRQWWTESDGLRRLPANNLIVQPRNRGTGIGILYSVLHILGRDPDARIVMLPSDHYVRDESILRDALRMALRRVEEGKGQPVLLGVEPDICDGDLGYIVPGGPDPFGGQRVAQFIEKPSTEAARDLIEQGALWNAFILAATAQSLLNLFLPRHAPIVMEMQVLLSRHQRLGSPAGGWPALVDMYDRLPTLDFSADLLAQAVQRLCAIRVPPCGWSDLGTPRRVGETLKRLPQRTEPRELADSTYLSLAVQHAQFQQTSAIGS